MQVNCRLLISFWVPLLCVAARKSSGLLRGYPLDSPNATWLPVEDEVDESLADTKDEIETAKKQLAYVKEYCNGKNHGRCKKQVERMSARLDRLIAAEKKLREKDKSAEKVEDNVRNSSETVVELEDQVNGLHAVKKFAELSKKDFDNQEKRLGEASDEYTKKIEQAQSQIDFLKQDLKRARRVHYDAEQKSLDTIAKAKGIERGVETTDLFADTEFARAVRKQRIAERLYARADAIREHAEKMIILHHDENKSEVKEVMYGTAHRMITQNQDIVNFGHMSDFGGELPHLGTRPCKKSFKKQKSKEQKDEEAEEEEEESNPNAPGGDSQPAAEVKIEPSQETSGVVNTNGEEWEEVDMPKANDHAEQWVAFPHHQSSKQTVTDKGYAKTRMVNDGQYKKPTERKPAPVVVEKTIEPRKELQAATSTEDDDEPQIIDDDTGSDNEINEIAAADGPVVQETSTTVVTTTKPAAPVVDASVPAQADPMEALASDDSSADIDEDSPESAEAEVDEDSANMDEAEQQFKEAEEAENALS